MRISFYLKPIQNEFVCCLFVCLFFVFVCLLFRLVIGVHSLITLLPKQVDCFFGDARNSYRWQESRMFWVTWQNEREHIPSCCLAQFFHRASSESSQSLIFGFRCQYNMIWIKIIVYAFPRDKKRCIFTSEKTVIAM